MSKHSILYVIQHQDTGLHKIGITNDWGRRQRELELGIKTRAVHVVRVNDARQVEKYLHRRFKAQRMPQSEWFNLDAEQLCFVRSTVLKARDDHRSPRNQAPAPGRWPLARRTSVAAPVQQQPVPKQPEGTPTSLPGPSTFQDVIGCAAILVGTGLACALLLAPALNQALKQGRSVPPAPTAQPVPTVPVPAPSPVATAVKPPEVSAAVKARIQAVAKAGALIRGQDLPQPKLSQSVDLSVLQGPSPIGAWRPDPATVARQVALWEGMIEREGDEAQRWLDQNADWCRISGQHFEPRVINPPHANGRELCSLAAWRLQRVQDMRQAQKKRAAPQTLAEDLAQPRQ